MRITSEDVKAVQSRIDVTYEEAERYLIKADGDIELALFMIKSKRESGTSKFIDEAKRVLGEILTYYIKVEKKTTLFLNMPLIFIIIFLLLLDLETKIWVLVVSVGVILITECHVSIFKDSIEKVDSEESEKPKEGPTDADLNEAVVTNNDESNQKQENGPQTDDDDYYEITIEK